MTLNRLKVLILLDECTGDDIWSSEHCRLREIPEAWIEELAENYESGFRSDTETIYVDGKVTNQYRGIRDVDLAMKLGEFLGLDTQQLMSVAVSRQHLVRLIREAIEDG